MLTRNNVRLIVTDMDGTFLGVKGALLPENGEALRAAARAGIHVGFASGRMPCMLSQIATDMGLEQCHIIGLNGAHVMDAPMGETLALHPISDALRDACLEILHREGCDYNLYTDEGIYLNRVMDQEAAADFRRRFSPCKTVGIGPDAAKEAEGKTCVKFLVRKASTEEALERAKAEIAALPGLAITSAAKGTFEIMPAGVDKANAVADLARRLGISMEQVMAFGDYDNDVTMLAACGHSVAMGNASPSARDAAVYQTIANVACGVAHAVNLLLAGRLEEIKR